MLEYLKIANKILFTDNNPLHFTFFVTSKCNYTCKTCFYWKELNNNHEELSLEEIKKVSEKIGKLGWLLISGGEPFLRKDLSEIIQVFNKNNKPFVTTIVTNGFNKNLIRKKVVEIVEKNKSPININFSIDGFSETHKLIRGKPLYKTLETYKEIKALKEDYPTLSVGIGTVYNKTNQDEMLKFYDFVRNDLKPDKWCLTMIRDRPKDPELKQINIENYAKINRMLEHNMKKENSYYNVPMKNIFIKKERLQNEFIEKLAKGEKTFMKCYAGGKSIVMTENGDIKTCEIKKFHIGNVRDYDYDIKKILSSDRAKDIRKRIDDTKCVCTHECNIASNILFNPTNYPKLAF